MTDEHLEELVEDIMDLSYFHFVSTRGDKSDGDFRNWLKNRIREGTRGSYHELVESETVGIVPP